MKLGVTGEVHFVTLDMGEPGYGIRGLPPQDYQLQLRGMRYSAIGILSMEGIQDVYITEGTVNGDVFLDFIYTQLLPILRPFDGRSVNSVVVMDNASIHHVAG